MKIWNKLRRTNQAGVLSLHAIVPIVLAIAAIGGVGAYVLSKSGASSTTQGQLTAQTGAYTLVPGWTSVLKANVDPADAADELVFYNATSGQVSGYQNSTATGLTGKIYDVKANPGWQTVLAANIDGDKDDELVYYNKTTGALAFYGATATTTGTKLATNTTTVPGYDLVVAMDVDGNNANDELMFYNKTTGATKMYKVTAAGLAATPYGSFTLSAGWDAIAGADFNGNGDDEAVFYRRSDGLLKVYDNVAAAGVSGEMANFVTDKTWTAVVGANLKNTAKDNLYFYNSATGAVKTFDGINFAYVPPAPTPAPGTTPPPPTVYKGTFECNVSLLSTTSATTAYSIKVTNKTDKMTSGLDEINMVGTTASGTKVTLNGTKDASQFTWTGGFSGSKMLVGSSVTFTIKGNGVAQDKWKLSISNVEYTCAAVASSGDTVDTKPYTNLPGAPSVDSMTYASWKAWSDGVTANKALTGQALVDKLKPLKDAYDAKVAFAATITCKGVFPAEVKLGTFNAPKPNAVSLQVTNKGKFVVPANTFNYVLVQKFSTDNAGKTISTSNIPVIAVNATVAKETAGVVFTQTNGTKVTLSYKLLNSEGKVVANCDNSYKSYDLSTGKETATPDKDKPAVVKLTGALPNSTNPPANTGSQATKKVADLGYGDNVKLHCINRKGTGKNATFTAVPCAQANSLVLTVGGTDNAKVKRSDLSYGVDVAKTKTDHFGTVDGCAKRNIVLNNKSTSFDCTVVYYNQSFFATTRNSVSNFFKKLILRAKADTNYTQSEANADIAKLKAGDLKSYQTKITLSKKSYVPQVVSGSNLILDYNEASAIAELNSLIDVESTGGRGTSVTQADDNPTVTTIEECGDPGSGYKWAIVNNECVRQPVAGSGLTPAQKCANANGEMVGDTCYKFSCPKRGPLNGVIVPGSRSPENQSLGRTCQYSALFLPTFYGKPNYSRVTLN